MAKDKLKGLQEDHNKLLHDMRVLNDASEDRNFTDEESEKYDKMEDDFSALEERIAREQKLESRKDIVTSLSDDFKSETKEDMSEAHARAYDSWIRKGDKGLSPQEREIVTRAQSIGTDSEGGYTVPTLLSDKIIQSMQDFGGMRSVATILTTGKGEQIDHTTNDDTGNVGALLTENSAVSEQDTVFGTKALNAYKYSSKIIKVSRELLNDSIVDMDAHLRGILAERLGRITNTHYTTGSGSSRANGVATAASAGKTAASSTAITFDEIYDLMDAMDPAYEQGNERFMINKSTLTAIRKLKDGNSQYLWSPPTAAAPAAIAGVPYTINQDIASIGSGAKCVLYGDFKKYVIRDVKGLEMFRFDELYAANYQVAFSAFLRTDGDLMDTAAIKYLRNTTT